MKRAISLLILSSACASPDGDIWFPADDSGGKADAYSTIKGGDIPSAFVDANKSYIISRRIDSLVNAGAFDMVESRLAMRIDGIIANMPADGRLHLAELVRMEDPQIHASLFADEVAALPRLWTKVEAPSQNDLVVGPDGAFGVLDTATPPGPAVVPASLLITSLPTDQQSAAMRLENIYNNDNNTSTVSLPDVDNGLNNPSPFLPAEITALNAIKARFKDLAVSNATAQLSVSPMPGLATLDTHLGPVMMHMSTTTSFDEERTYQGNQTLTIKLTASQGTKTVIGLPADEKLLVIEKDSLAETVVSNGETPSVGGPVVFEVWKANQRIFASNAVLPSLARAQMLDLSDKLDYKLIAGLTPLVKNIEGAVQNPQTGVGVAHWTFDKTTVNPMHGVDQILLQRVATPIVKLPVGRYTFPQANIVFNVYPNNVIWVTRGTTQYRLLPIGNSGAAPTRFYNQGGSIVFDSTSSQLNVSSASFNQVLTASMRDI